MAENAKTLVKHNKLDDIIEVIHSTVEDLDAARIGQVDILISEPLGTILVNERMIETYIIARDRFLKPSGKLSKQSCICLAGEAIPCCKRLRLVLQVWQVESVEL